MKLRGKWEGHIWEEHSRPGTEGGAQREVGCIGSVSSPARRPRG